MKKILLSVFLSLLLSGTIYSQKDSVHSLFNATPHIRIPLKYSYLQWDLGYTNFLFSNTDLGGISLDLVGLVFNDDLDIAAGFEGANGGYGRGIATVTTVRSYDAFYFKFVPMLSPEKLINFSMPLKFSYATLGITAAGTYAGGYGRGGGRGRGGPGTTFYSFTPGADVFVNLLHFLSLGAGVNYRLAFSTPGSYSPGDYDNVSFSGILRLKIYPNKKPVPHSDYYAPPQQRFNQ